MYGLILLSILLTLSVGAISIAIYHKQAETLRKNGQQQQMLANLDTALKNLYEQQVRLGTRIDQLAADVLQKDVYQNADDRHQLAIQSAKQGKSLVELTQRHGLSTDEAALLLSLHKPKKESDQTAIKNANLYDSSEADLA